MDVRKVHLRLDTAGGGRWRPDRWATANLAGASALLWCASDGRALFQRADGASRSWNDPREALRWMEQSIAGRSDTRWIGYLSYDLGRWFERLPSRAADDLSLPLFAFSLHEDGGPTMAVAGEYETGSAGALRSNFTREAYLAAVARAIEYIAAGDIFQVNLSQRFTAPLVVSPAEIYARLRDRWPAVYGAYMDFGDFALVSNSPELFLRVTPSAEGRRVLTRPIKGTRPLQPGMERELRESIKDQAELNMIVDLERNDLGRVCRIGSVQVIQPRVIEAHPTVYHGVATVQGMLREGVGFVDLLAATFPGGSITGAPKIRAMEIIDELEPTRRGPYCGAIGWIGGDGAMELNIAIRTMVVKDRQVHMQVGGGIVADSTPQGEFDETLVKAKAMFAALGIGG